MAAQRETGLDGDQLDRLRSEVAAGRRPRVQVAAAQFPSGTTGAVLRVGDPATDGADYVTVRVKVGGVVDELGFAPAELSVASRRRAKATPDVSAPASDGASAPTPPTPNTPAAKTSSANRRAPRARAAAGGSPAGSSTRPAVTAPAAARREPAQPARSTRRAAPPATVRITIASEGSSWSVSAQRGARAVVKKAALPPGVVAAAVGLLGQPELEEAVAAVNDTARVEAEARAERLRAELAEVEAVLNSHRRP